VTEHVVADAGTAEAEARAEWLAREPAATTRPRRSRGWLVRRMLLVADLLGLSLAFLLAQYALGAKGTSHDIVPPWQEMLYFLAALPVWVIVGQLSGLYDRDDERADHSTADDVVGVFVVVTVGTWLVTSIAWLTHALSPDPPRMVGFWLMTIGFVVTGRVVARALAPKDPRYLQNTVIVGGGEVGQLVGRKLLKHPEYGLNLLGFIDDRPKERRTDLADLTLIGAIEDLPRLVTDLSINRVIVAFSNDPHRELLDLIRALRALSVQVDIVPRLFEIVGPNVHVHTVEGLPLVGLPPARPSRSARAVKRTMDIVVAASALLLTAPLFAYISFRIKRDSPGPIFFRQKRLGLNMQEFTALKFRTMHMDVDDSAHRAFIRATMRSDPATGADGLYKLDRGDAVTAVGRWLRRTSLDELPQFLNVLRGQMSLVGPRPCIPYETENFAPHHFERFLVAPGLTGLWQVTARARSSFGEALEMDVAYARGWSLGLDLRLLCRTPLALLRQGGSTA
jgi:exopolysaccharide biosynthesis polyprenyl glycosylphosphotransferase